MFQRFLALFALVLTGCSQMPVSTQQVGGTGRFLQFNTNGQTYLQFDTVSLEACKRQGIVSKPNQAVEILCSTVSQEAAFPYSFTLTNVLTSEHVIARTRNMDGCELFHKEFEKLKAAPNSQYSVYKADTCK